MSKGFVSLGHLMGIFFLLESGTSVIVGIEKFGGEPLAHLMTGTGT